MLRLREVAVMAAQAEQDAADFLGSGGDAVGQNFNVLPLSPKAMVLPYSGLASCPHKA